MRRDLIFSTFRNTSTNISVKSTTTIIPSISLMVPAFRKMCSHYARCAYYSYLLVIYTRGLAIHVGIKKSGRATNETIEIILPSIQSKNNTATLILIDFETYWPPRPRLFHLNHSNSVLQS